jgi:hypothetical protein
MAQGQDGRVARAEPGNGGCPTRSNEKLPRKSTKIVAFPRKRRSVASATLNKLDHGKKSGRTSQRGASANRPERFRSAKKAAATRRARESCKGRTFFPEARFIVQHNAWEPSTRVHV